MRIHQQAAGEEEEGDLRLQHLQEGEAAAMVAVLLRQMFRLLMEREEAVAEVVESQLHRSLYLTASPVQVVVAEEAAVVEHRSLLLQRAEQDQARQAAGAVEEEEEEARQQM